MKFGSWTFDSQQVGLDWYEGKERVDLTDYVNSGTWDIIECPGVKGADEEKNQNDDKHKSAFIEFYFKIRRKTLFYTVNLIIPCVLISFLSVCVFYLPADAGEKMTMCISILLALVVFLLLVSKILPPTSINIPLIAKYLLFTFVMNIFTILITVVIINWNFRTPRTHRMSKWVRVVFLNYLPRLLFMKRPNHSERWAKKSYSKMQSNSANANHSYSRENDVRQFVVNARSNIVELSDISHDNHHGNCTTNRANHSSASSHGDHHNNRCNNAHHHHNNSGDSEQQSTFQMTPETHKAVEAVRFIAAHLKNEDDYSEVGFV